MKLTPPWRSWRVWSAVILSGALSSALSSTCGLSSVENVVLAFLVGGVTGVLGMRWQVSVDREAERDAANDPPGFVDIADRVV